MFVTLDTTQLLRSALNKEARLKAIVFERRKKKGKMWNGPNKTTKDHNYINNWQGMTYCRPCLSHLTRPSCWCRRWTRKHHKRLLCLGGGGRKVRCEMDQNKTTKEHNYQQLARKDVLFSKDVTLDTTQLLMSALNEEAYWKAVVFGRRKKKV